ncbi:hypothetical protein E3N88_43340 [Mikania micrantha]|uniref:Uncharacterized protein n=1 Tax=Mikania micrantha TaxID=192012 RepID=A0A5N6LF64_9ASTR|nr:hypothetical protein E3N88_43340 [Mikania micrantha]
MRTLKLGELFGILSAYQMEIDAQEPRPTSVPSGSAALYAPIYYSPFQNYLYHSNSSPIITFLETPTTSTTHSNPFSSSTPLITSSQGAFMAEETNYFHLCQEDLDGIPADDLKEMDINYQMAMISYRAKKFYQRTGRQFRKHNMKTGFGLDKSKLKCFNYWSFQAEDASTSNNALMANDSTSTFKVTEDMCTSECLEKLNAYKRFNAQVCNELESLQVVKASFFEAERNYKENIEELEKTISSLKHEDTNKQCQINNLLERLTTAKTELVLAESYRDKFLSQGEKYEKLFKMSETSALVKKKGAGLGYNKMEPPSAYTPMVEVRCKPETNLVYDETTSKQKKNKKNTPSFVKAKYVQTGSTSSDDYVTCASDKSKRARSKDRKASVSRIQVNHSTNSPVGTSKSEQSAILLPIASIIQEAEYIQDHKEEEVKKGSWSKSYVSSEEQSAPERRKSVKQHKKPLEAGTSDNEKRRNKKSSGKKKHRKHKPKVLPTLSIP